MAEEIKETQETAAANDIPKEDMEKLIRRNVYASMAVGLIPVPVADFAGVTLIQLNMLRVIAKKYGVPFSNSTAKNILSALVGGAVPASVSGPLAASLSKLVPAAGTTVGVITMPIVSGAATYAVGKVFVQHFASGGTFLTFKPEKVKAYYEEMFNKGKKIAGAKA